jgi:hypothetical protein
MTSLPRLFPIMLVAASVTGLQIGCGPAGSKSEAPAVRHEEPAAPPAPEAEVPAGTLVAVRLNQAISTASNRPGDRFTATLESTLSAGRTVVVPRGARVHGIVEGCAPSGRLRWRPVLRLSVHRVDVLGQSYPLTASPWSSSGKRPVRRGGPVAAAAGRIQLALRADTVLTFRLKEPMRVVDTGPLLKEDRA